MSLSALHLSHSFCSTSNTYLTSITDALRRNTNSHTAPAPIHSKQGTLQSSDASATPRVLLSSPLLHFWQPGCGRYSSFTICRNPRFIYIHFIYIHFISLFHSFYLIVVFRKAMGEHNNRKARICYGKHS